MNTFWANVFFSGDRQPVNGPVQVTGVLLHARRYYALSYRLLYCAVQYGRTQSYGYGSKSLWIRLKVPPQRTGDVRRSAARRRCLACCCWALLAAVGRYAVAMSAVLRACWPPDRRP